MIVRDIMTHNPEYVDTDSTVQDILEKMFTLDVRHIPVVHEGELVGIVSDRDIRDHSLPADDGSQEPPEMNTRLDFRVSEVMSGGVVFINPESTLAEIVELMVETKIGAIPVVEPSSQKLVGIVSYIDVLKATLPLVG